MTSTTDSRRDDKARFALANSGQWLRVRDRATGRVVAYGFASTSRPGTYHLATPSRCTCEGAQWGHRCYRQRAAALYVEQARRRGGASPPSCPERTTAEVISPTSAASSTSAHLWRRRMLSKSTAGQVAGPSSELELVNYGAGWAWLRPEPHPVRVVHDLDAPLSPDDRVALTDLGRRALAMAALFDDEWPTVAEVSA